MTSFTQSRSAARPGVVPRHDGVVSPASELPPPAPARRGSTGAHARAGLEGHDLQYSRTAAWEPARRSRSRCSCRPVRRGRPERQHQPLRVQARVHGDRERPSRSAPGRRLAPKAAAVARRRGSGSTYSTLSAPSASAIPPHTGRSTPRRAATTSTAAPGSAPAAGRRAPASGMCRGASTRRVEPPAAARACGPPRHAHEVGQESAQSPPTAPKPVHRRPRTERQLPVPRAGRLALRRRRPGTGC